MFDRLDNTEKKMLTAGFISAGLIAQALIIGFVIASTDCFCKLSCVDYRLERCSGLENFSEGHTNTVVYRVSGMTAKNLSELEGWGRK